MCRSEANTHIATSDPTSPAKTEGAAGPKIHIPPTATIERSFRAEPLV